MKLWIQLTRIAQKAGYEALEKALWLYFAAQRPGTPAWARNTIYGALAYIVFPLDAVPDMLPGGYTDDLGVLAAAVGAVSLFITDDVKEQAQGQLRTWFGE